jgi:hypothetical protein
MRLERRVPQGNADHLLKGITFGVDVTGGVGLKGVSRVTLSFALNNVHDLTFAFFCDNRLMFDRPTTGILSLSQSRSFVSVLLAIRATLPWQFYPPGWSFFLQPRPCVTVALEV